MLDELKALSCEASGKEIRLWNSGQTWKLFDLGAESVPDAKLTPEGLRSWLKQETERWGPVIRAAGVYAD